MKVSVFKKVFFILLFLFNIQSALAYSPNSIPNNFFLNSPNGNLCDSCTNYSPDVRYLQTLLNNDENINDNFIALVEDGNFGGKTEDALIEFQNHYELSADGIGGDKTKRELDKVLARIKGVDSPPNANTYPDLEISNISVRPRTPPREVIFVGNEFDIEVRVRNRGSESVDSFEVEYFYGGTSQNFGSIFDNDSGNSLDIEETSSSEFSDDVVTTNQSGTHYVMACVSSGHINDPIVNNCSTTSFNVEEPSSNINNQELLDQIDELSQLQEEKENELNNVSNDRSGAEGLYSDAVNSCNNNKFPHENYENDLREFDPISDSQLSSSASHRKGGNKIHVNRCKDSQCITGQTDYEIKITYDLNDQSTNGSIVNYPARIESTITINGTKSIFDEKIVNNYDYKRAYEIYLVNSLKQELASNSSGGFSPKCNIGDYSYKDWSIAEWTENVRQHANFNNTVSEIQGSVGGSTSNISDAVANGIAQALREIVQEYKELPGAVTNAIGSILSLTGDFVQDPSGTAQRVKNEAVQFGDFAVQLANDIAEVVVDLPNAFDDWEPYDRAYFIAYIGTFVGHEATPTSKLKLLKLGSIGKPLWLQKSLIAVRLHKIQDGNFVYAAFRPDGKIQYVGITDNMKRRGRQHMGDKGILIRNIRGLENLTREDSHACEQFLIQYFGLYKEKGGTQAGQLININNSIARSRDKDGGYYTNAVIRGKILIESAGFDYQSFKD